MANKILHEMTADLSAALDISSFINSWKFLVNLTFMVFNESSWLSSTFCRHKNRSFFVKLTFFKSSDSKILRDHSDPRYKVKFAERTGEPRWPKPEKARGPKSRAENARPWEKREQVGASRAPTPKKNSLGSTFKLHFKIN